MIIDNSVLEIDSPAKLPSWDFIKCECKNNSGEYCDHCCDIWFEFKGIFLPSESY